MQQKYIWIENLIQLLDFDWIFKNLIHTYP